MGLYSFGHCTRAVSDMIFAEQFYSEVLGEIIPDSRVWDRSGLTTNHIVTREKLRPVMEARRAEDRPNEDQATRFVISPHSAVKVGKALIPFFLYHEHVQEPPPEQLVGTPRFAISVTPEQMEKAVEVLRRHKVAFKGPVEHPIPCPATRSLYFKDPSSNFLELCCPRDDLG